jgi:BON domain
VQNGIAELRGTIFDERERKAVRIAAENVPGIAGVKDHLVWLEPITGLFFEPPDDTLCGQR